MKQNQQEHVLWAVHAQLRFDEGRGLLIVMTLVVTGRRQKACSRL